MTKFKSLPFVGFLLTFSSGLTACSSCTGAEAPTSSGAPGALGAPTVPPGASQGPPASNQPPMETLLEATTKDLDKARQKAQEQHQELSDLRDKIKVPLEKSQKKQIELLGEAAFQFWRAVQFVRASLLTPQLMHEFGFKITQLPRFNLVETGLCGDEKFALEVKFDKSTLESHIQQAKADYFQANGRAELNERQKRLIEGAQRDHEWNQKRIAEHLEKRKKICDVLTDLNQSDKFYLPSASDLAHLPSLQTVVKPLGTDLSFLEPEYVDPKNTSLLIEVVPPELKECVSSFIQNRMSQNPSIFIESTIGEAQGDELAAFKTCLSQVFMASSEKGGLYSKRWKIGKISSGGSQSTYSTITDDMSFNFLIYKMGRLRDVVQALKTLPELASESELKYDLRQQGFDTLLKHINSLTQVSRNWFQIDAYTRSSFILNASSKLDAFLAELNQPPFPQETSDQEKAQEFSQALKAIQETQLSRFVDYTSFLKTLEPGAQPLSKPERTSNAEERPRYQGLQSAWMEQRSVKEFQEALQKIIQTSKGILPSEGL